MTSVFGSAMSTQPLRAMRQLIAGISGQRLQPQVAAAPRVARDTGISGLFSYSARVINTSSADASRLEQGIELGRAGEAAPFAVGSTWTLSYYATAPQTVFNLAFFDNVFPGDNPSGNQPDPGEVELEDLGGGWKRYSRTITIAGGPAGSNLCLRLALGASNPCDYKITGIQLEPGPVATPFEQRPIGLELSLCQRYFFKTQSSNNGVLMGGGCTGPNTATMTTDLPVPMRVSPAGNLGFQNLTLQPGNNSPTPSTDRSTPERLSLLWTASGMTLGSCYFIQAQSGQTGFITADAEL